MSHMFCTLQEAARTLNTSEDEIQALLERGLLREFREGPHRLLKEAEVGALARQQAQRREPGSAASSSPNQGAEAGRPAPSRRPHSASAASRLRQSAGVQNPGPGRQTHGMGIPDRRATPYTSGPVACSRRAWESGPGDPDRRPSGRVSVGQWFWMGLIQDRPMAIALLSGLVLALLAVLVAGLCFLAQTS